MFHHRCGFWKNKKLIVYIDEVDPAEDKGNMRKLSPFLIGQILFLSIMIIYVSLQFSVCEIMV